MKIALVHPWLTNMGGAERLLLELHELYPEAPIYTSVYDRAAMPAFENIDVRTSIMQKLPLMRYKQQIWSAIRPFAFKKIDLSEFDVVISVDHAEAKNIRVRDDAIHICYCNSPTRYFWSHYHEYKSDPGFGALNPLIKLIMPLAVWPLRKVDYKAAQKVDYFISNSSEIQKRVTKYYDRESVVVNPPVSASRFTPKHEKKRSGYAIASRQTPYKRVDLAIEACNELGLELKVIGEGTEFEKLKELAGPTVKMMGRLDDEQMINELQRSEAFIFPAEEDFGIVPIEAMAAGCPVVAYGKGGVVDWMVEGKTGEVFNHQTVHSLVDLLKRFRPEQYKKADLYEHADKFNEDRFRLEMKEFVDSVSNPKN